MIIIHHLRSPQAVDVGYCRLIYTYWTSQGNARRGIAWWKTGLDVAPLPENCFSFLYGFKIRGPGKGNDLVGTKETLQWAKKWAKHTILSPLTIKTTEP
jgi:hypothetical protein